jgi:NADPH:quinone reductase-like Zn-dependent oxidoreductase
MKAIQAATSGDYEALHFVDIPHPQAQAGQALVQVTSAGVTPFDHFVLAGMLPSAKKPPLVLGNEGAGIVKEDSSGRFSAGERVLFFAGPGGLTQDGTFAEMTLVPSGNLAAPPGEIPDKVASGLPVAFLTAFLALRQAGFRQGQSVLALAAATIVDGMHKTGAHRLIAVSVAVAFVTEDPDKSWIAKQTQPRIFARVFADVRRMQRALRDSAPDWTLVRTTRPVNDPGKGEYRVGADPAEANSNECLTTSYPLSSIKRS